MSDQVVGRALAILFLVLVAAVLVTATVAACVKVWEWVV